MELQQGVGHFSATSLDVFRAGVDDQQHWRHEGRQVPSEFASTLGRDVARALVVQHEAHGIGAGVGGRVHIGLAREAADLDARAVSVHGNQSKVGVRCGKPHAGS
ncbi:hypothetical protein FQZ97_734810 [compost metagenome]